MADYFGGQESNCPQRICRGFLVRSKIYRKNFSNRIPLKVKKAAQKVHLAAGGRLADDPPMLNVDKAPPMRYASSARSPRRISVRYNQCPGKNTGAILRLRARRAFGRALGPEGPKDPRVSPVKSAFTLELKPAGSGAQPSDFGGFEKNSIEDI